MATLHDVHRLTTEQRAALASAVESILRNRIDEIGLITLISHDWSISRVGSEAATLDLNLLPIQLTTDELRSIMAAQGIEVQ